MADFESDGDVLPKQKSMEISVPKKASENANGCFECNICFVPAHDPVVTLCGHLYCWPCIYKWLHVQTLSLESDELPKCPVCKANVSDSSLVPLYGRGPSSESDAGRPQLDPVIPHRPRARGLQTMESSLTSHPNQQLYENPFHSMPQSFHHQQISPNPYGSYASWASSNLGDTAMTSVSSSAAGMFGDMVFARMLGSPAISLFAHHYQSSSPLMGSGSLRIRRQEIQVERSLNRVSIFLFCCVILCLISF